MGREFELKFMATEEILSAVEEKYGPFVPIEMETTYYDTPDGALAGRHITLRRRMENGLSVCTVKTPLSDGSRGEWECHWQDPDTMVDALWQHGAPEEIRHLTAGGIVPVCGAKFRRLAKTVEGEGWAAEIALDKGLLLGGGKEIPLCELEVELKSGDDREIMVFAQALAAEFGLKPQKDSKFRRAQRLAKGE